LLNFWFIFFYFISYFINIFVFIKDFNIFFLKNKKRSFLVLNYPYGKNDFKKYKISKKHHQMLKEYCDKNGFKMYKIIQKWIEENCSFKKRDIYGEN